MTASGSGDFFLGPKPAEVTDVMPPFQSPRKLILHRRLAGSAGSADNRTASQIKAQNSGRCTSTMYTAQTQHSLGITDHTAYFAHYCCVRYRISQIDEPGG
uniref:Uncharacterized protein n=1 Tax=Anguilla anguilla TaxID=7936 RepID=A0A0E9WRS0_ANGAN